MWGTYTDECPTRNSGMSSANMHLLTLDVEIKASDPVPVAKLEPGTS